MKRFILFFLVLFFVFADGVFAVENPLDTANNRFGIHIIDENDLEDAARLVNSNGGEWGYVTVVIREDEMDVGRWQRVFDRMRELNIIPIVRIATVSRDGVWEKPLASGADEWAEFLSSLNWPIKNRYVVLFNEPNHESEWGGEISPVEYAAVARAYRDALKRESEDFFVLPAGLDLAAPDGVSTMNASRFFDEMYEFDNDIFQIFDGWVSHSYPNPGFSSSPDNAGKLSVRGFLWELEYLDKYGLGQDTPVFITETGWINNGRDLSENYVGAYENAWNDARVVAVTPFLLNYTGEPFESFSWKTEDGFHPQYTAVAGIPKTSGKPVQVHSFEVVENNIPSSLIRNSNYSFNIVLKNTGQSIWEKGEFELIAETESDLAINISDFYATRPGEEMDLIVDVGTYGVSGALRFELVLYKDGDRTEKRIIEAVSVVPPPSLLVFVNEWLEKAPTYDDYTLEIYDGDRKVLEFTNLLVVEGLGQINEVYDIVPNRRYQFLLSRPYYLATSRMQLLSLGENRIDFGVMLPVDLDGDSKLGMGDIGAYFANPKALLYSIIPK